MAVGDCEPGQFLDRSAPGADREIFWDFSITSDPERCLQIKAGQSVFWNVNGDFETHPLSGLGGDTPNPISTHQNGLVTFTRPGTFGFVCLNHSVMKGAILVVPAAPPTASVPALPPWLAVFAALVPLVLGWLLVRRRQATMAAMRTQHQ